MAIILMTADFTFRQPAILGRRADGYLLKPLDLEELARTVGEVLKQDTPYPQVPYYPASRQRTKRPRNIRERN